MKALNKTEFAIFVSLTCSLLPKEPSSQTIFSYMSPPPKGVGWGGGWGQRHIAFGAYPTGVGIGFLVCKIFCEAVVGF